MASKQVVSEDSSGHEEGQVACHTKLPGFDAFNDVPIPLDCRVPGKQKMVPCFKLAVPSKGVHASQWAQEIVPGNGGPFFDLGYEVRVMIYEFYIIDAFSEGIFEATIIPTKHGNKFVDSRFLKALNSVTFLYRLCKQSYVDTCASGLLYKFIPFDFTSAINMLNYALVINPLHKDAIRTIKLNFSISATRPSLSPKMAFEVLSGIRGLRSFTLIITVGESLYDVTHHNSPQGVLLYTECKISRRAMNIIRNNMALRKIRGLREFHLIIKRGTFIWEEPTSIIVMDPNWEQDRCAEVENELAGLLCGSEEGNNKVFSR